MHTSNRHENLIHKQRIILFLPCLYGGDSAIPALDSYGLQVSTQLLCTDVEIHIPFCGVLPLGHEYETLGLVVDVLIHWVPESVDPVGQL